MPVESGMASSLFRFRQAAELLGVSDDTIRRWAEDGRLRTTVDAAGRKAIDGTELARFAEQLAQPRGGRRHQSSIIGRSARNTLTGLVTRVTKDTVMAQVELQAGPFRIVSLMSREAADNLGLEPGVLALASIKSTNVVVEIPAP
jgi:molybdopterin-binding protein